MFDKISRLIRFNLRYLGQPPWDTGVSPPELIDFLESGMPGRALDVGCGTGTNLLTMASYDWQVVGVDIALLSVLKARWKLHQAGVQGRVQFGNVAGLLQLTESFDLVLDMGCYHSLGPRERVVYHDNLIRWLAPGGTYLQYAHLQTNSSDPHGVSDDDFLQFSRYLDLQWRKDNAEHRPDDGGGRPATWARFERPF